MHINLLREAFTTCHFVQVKVVDRSLVVTANAETTVVSPVGIQEAINAITGKLLHSSLMWK